MHSISKKRFSLDYIKELFISRLPRKLANYGNFEICRKSINFYQSTGLIIPPNTVFKGIYQSLRIQIL